MQVRWKRAARCGVWLVLAGWAGSGGMPACGMEGAALYRAARRASAFVLVDGRHKGSAFFADPGGLLVTTAHMVKGKTKGIEVVSPAAGRQAAERVAIDLGHDLALLRVPARDKPYPALPIADRMPAPGSQVLLFGDPVFRHRLLLGGRVAVLAPRYCYNPGVKCYVRVFYIAGTSPEGTSGGCWIDRSGRVVGVQGGYLNSPKAPAGIAFACPPDAIRRLLATRASPPTPTLGTRLDELWTQPTGFIARFPKGTTGIATVVPDKDGPVAKAKLNKESLITAIDGKPVAYIDELLAAVRSKKPGDEVTLDVTDPDKKPTRRVKVRLAQVKE